jgi:hypothetical protein
LKWSKKAAGGHQTRLFTDRHGQSVTTAAPPEDVAEVLLSSLVVATAGRACWVGCKLWEELALGEFWQRVLAWKSAVDFLYTGAEKPMRARFGRNPRRFPRLQPRPERSADARYITGQVLNVNGGFHM